MFVFIPVCPDNTPTYKLYGDREESRRFFIFVGVLQYMCRGRVISGNKLTRLMS